MDGFFLVDKPAGMTSFDVCAKIRKMMRIKKVGHTGTLDPFATGLLLVAVGKCTKLIPFFEKKNKTYRTKILLGKSSETLDPESEIIEIDENYLKNSGKNPLFKNKKPERADIEKILKSNFLGPIEQIPPKYSAIKINGQRAYKRARNGEAVEIKPRMTQVHSIELLAYHYPELEVKIETASGFYVRSFARDIGEMLVGGGLCVDLRRTAIGDISVKYAEPLERLTNPIDPKFLIGDLQHREIDTGRIQDFMSGRAFPFPGVNNEKVLVLCGGKTVGIGEFIHEKLQPRLVIA